MGEHERTRVDGELYYASGAIKDHIALLSRTFSGAFRHVVVLDDDGRFLSLLDARAVNAFLSGPRKDNLMDLFNCRSDEKSGEEVTAGLATFGGLRTPVSLDWTIGNALKVVAWRNPGRLDDEAPVVDGRRKFVGTTTRRKLIAAALPVRPTPGEGSRR